MSFDLTIAREHHDLIFFVFSFLCAVVTLYLPHHSQSDGEGRQKGRQRAMRAHLHLNCNLHGCLSCWEWETHCQIVWCDCMHSVPAFSLLSDCFMLAVPDLSLLLIPGNPACLLPAETAWSSVLLLGYIPLCLLLLGPTRSPDTLKQLETSLWSKMTQTHKNLKDSILPFFQLPCSGFQFNMTQNHTIFWAHHNTFIIAMTIIVALKSANLQRRELWESSCRQQLKINPLMLT